MKRITLLDAVHDLNLFASWFDDPATWTAWWAFLTALFALPMSAEQVAVYQQCTGRTVPPTHTATEAWLICGRRAGKSFVLALVAVFLATFHDYRRFLSPGERGTVIIIATNARQARVIFRYIRALLTHVPMIARMVERETADAFDLTNAVTIEVGTTSFKTTRGYTIVAALCDEIAFWPTDDAASPDYEILDALRPGMATIPNAMLLCASSPYARRGALWDVHRRHFAKDGDTILVWQAVTRTMNPTVPQRVIDEAIERDAASASAEWLAQFRSDIEGFIAREVVDHAITPDRFELPPMSHVTYTGFVDPSGGSTDSMTLAIAHRDQDGRVILDLVREHRPPFSPEAVVREFSALAKMYRLHTLTGDHWGGEFVREPFRTHGIKYDPSDKPKSDLYRDFLPLANSGKVELLDHARLATQLCALERRTARSGRDSIDHAPGGHDDIANAVAGALVLAATARPPMRISPGAMARARERPPRGTMRPSRWQSPRCFFGSSDQR
jgi:hypothetical protein